jgi:ABC-type nitrate/sulfonate/bicarbonate transport system substrate-binding protein
MNKNIVLKIIFVLVIIFGVFGYYKTTDNNSGEQKPITKDKLRVQLGWLPNGEFAFICSSIVNGYYAEKNLDVEMIPGGPSGANFIVATSTIAQDSNLDIGIESDMVPILHGVAKEKKEETLKIKMIASFWNDVPLGFSVRKDSGMTSLKDLGKPMKNGKMPRIGVTSDFVLQGAMADYAGVDVNDLNFVTTGFDATPFLASQVDALAGYWTTQVYEIEQAGIDYNFLDISELPNFRQPSMIVVATDKKISEKKEQIKRFVEATKKGVQFVIDNPEEAAKQILDSRCGGNKFDVTQETWLIKKSLPLYKNDNSYGKIDIEKINNFAKAFYDLKQIPFIPPSSEYIDTSFYED